MSKQKDFLFEILRQYEGNKDYDEARKEYESLSTVKSSNESSPPVTIYREQHVTEEHKSFKPALFRIIHDACTKKVQNGSNAWTQYVTLMQRHKAQAVKQQQNNKLNNQAKEVEISEKQPTPEEQSSNHVDTGAQTADSEPSPNLAEKPDNESEKDTSAQIAVSDSSPDLTEKPDNESEKKDSEDTVDIMSLLEKEKDTESLNYEHAHRDFTHLFTSKAVLQSTFPHANIFDFVKVTIKCPEDIPEEWRDRPLYEFLNTLEPEKFGESFASVWQEYGQLAIAEKQLEMARNARGPDLNVFAIVEKKQYFDMQNELQSKVEEVEELSTRLSRFASQQLTEGNPNIADLSDVHRPTRLGEMYSQVFDDEWSDAFEALKPKEDTEEDIHPVTLKQLQNIAKEIYSFCKEESENQLIHLEKMLSEAVPVKEQSLLTSVAFERTTSNEDQSLVEEEKMDVDVSQTSKDENMETNAVTNSENHSSQQKGQTEQTVERHARDFRKAVAAESAKNRAQVFIERKLPELVGDRRDDDRIKAYVEKCIELCWYMGMQDPPMMLVFPKEGDEIDKNEFSHHGRRGKLVETCVWPALLLHDKGPVVCKGYVLPQAKAK